jgi:hypothetical protein
VLDLEPVNETTGFIQSGIIGGNFLRYYRVSFDFKRSVIWLEPLAATASADEDQKQRQNVEAGQL